MVRIKLRKEQSNKQKYISYVVTIPKEILQKAPRFKKQKYVEIEVDLLRNIVIRPE